MSTLFGMGIQVSNLVQPVPKIQLSPGFEACTDSFKAEMNKWLLDTFGSHEVMYRVGKNGLFMNHYTLEKLEQSIANNNTSWPN